MKLDSIAGSVEDFFDKVMETLSYVSSGSMIDGGDTQRSWPFIYSYAHGLFVGEKNTYHHQLIKPISDPGIRATLSKIYSSGRFDPDQKPGVAGRVGYGLAALAEMTKDYFNVPIVPEVMEKLKTKSAVALYSYSDPAWVDWALYELLQQGYVKADDFVIIGENKPIELVGDRAQPPPPKPTINQAGPVVPVKNRPGMKWWAPTSESKRNRSSL